MKICTDCKHCYALFSTCFWCQRKVKQISVVNGKAEDIFTRNCADERAENRFWSRVLGSCGKEARFFEPKGPLTTDERFLCDGCKFHKIKSRDNPSDPRNPHADLLFRTVREPGTCITGIEWCTKYDKKLFRVTGGQSSSYRLGKCVLRKGFEK